MKKFIICNTQAFRFRDVIRGIIYRNRLEVDAAEELFEFMDPDLEKIKRILKETEVIAVVGVSTNPDKTACTVPRYLKRHGYRIIPVNPNAVGELILEEQVYGALTEIPDKVDMVQVFRPSEEAPAIAGDAVQIGAKFLWMQSGIVSEEAKEIAESAGLLVIMDMCARVCHRLLSGQGEL